MVPIGKNKDTEVNWFQKAEEVKNMKKEAVTKETVTKIAYSFFGSMDSGAPWGPYQNLDLNMQDRIYSADDEEPSEKDRELQIRKQFRYNPTYTRGIYYTVDNIRGFPYMADNPNNNNLHLHPLERMASADENIPNIEIDGDLTKVLSVLSKHKFDILNENSLATRFVMTNDFFPMVSSIFDSKDIRVDIFETDNIIGDNDKVYNVWISNSNIPYENVEDVEMYLTYGQEKEEIDILVEKLLGNKAVKTEKEKAIKKIVSEAKKICEQYGIKDVYLVGGYARDIEMGNSLSDIRDLDFSGAWTGQCMKVGGLLAERLGVRDVEISHTTMTLHFIYNDVKVDFRGNYVPMNIREKMREMGVKTTPLNMDVYNRDFTINMLLYNVTKEKIFDVSGQSKKDISKRVIRTYFDPNFVCSENPLVILRALKFKIRYDFAIDGDLFEAIKTNAHLLFDGRYSDDRLLFERSKVEIEGKEESDNLFYALGLEKILDY